MLCLEECLSFCDLEQDEIEAIAEHEHIPIICAAEMGCELLKTPSGVERLHSFLLDDIEHAIETGHAERAGRWLNAYRHLRATHPA